MFLYLLQVAVASVMTNNNVVTLSWLLAQDLPQAYIFTERPSTFNHNATFVNDKKYVIHDYLPNITEDNRHLKAMRACPVAGSKFPILVTRDINPLIREVRLPQEIERKLLVIISIHYLAG